MIRFTCPECKQPVRVSDTFGGKKGRCPSCKQVVHIPAVSEADLDEQARLAAPPPPPPPAQAEPESEMELRDASDPRNQTDKLESVREEQLLQFSDHEESDEPAPAKRSAKTKPEPGDAPAKSKKRRAMMKSPMFWGLVGMGVLIAAGVVAIIIHFHSNTGGGPNNVVVKPDHKTTTQKTTQKSPATAAISNSVATSAVVAEVPKTYELSSDIQAATARAPSGVMFMLHVDLAALAKAVPDMGQGGSSAAAVIARSDFWKDAAARVEEGVLPVSATLYLVKYADKEQPDSAQELLGGFFGATPDGATDATAGLWSITAAAKPWPHFLLRLAGPATNGYSAALIERAKSMGVPSPEPGRPANFAKLRLSPAGLTAKDEMLVGTVRTLTEEGLPNVDGPRQLQLRQTLQRVETAGRPIVGLAFIKLMRAHLSNALSALGQPKDSYDGLMIFSVDPRSTSQAAAGQASILLRGVEAGSVSRLQQLVAPMVAVKSEDELRLTGTAAEGLDTLAKLVPGFEEVLLKAMKLAPAIGAKSQAPVEPTPTTTTAGPVVTPTAPANDKLIPLICINAKCPNKGVMFTLPESKVGLGVTEGANPEQCPKCKEITAVMAVQCTNCKKWFSALLDACPSCQTKRAGVVDTPVATKPSTPTNPNPPTKPNPAKPADPIKPPVDPPAKPAKTEFKLKGSKVGTACTFSPPGAGAKSAQLTAEKGAAYLYVAFEVDGKLPATIDISGVRAETKGVRPGLVVGVFVGNSGGPEATFAFGLRGLAKPTDKQLAVLPAPPATFTLDGVTFTKNGSTIRITKGPSNFGLLFIVPEKATDFVIKGVGPEPVPIKK